MRSEIVDTASPKLKAMANRVADLTPLMESFGRHMMPSIRKNFDVGGRPAWQPLVGVTILPKGTTKKGYRTQGRPRMGGPLVLTGDLRGSVTFIPEKADLILTAHPDPNVKGPVHQFGTNRAGRHHNVTIPARPYLVFQPEDVEWFRKACDGWIRVGGVG